jgi:PHD/YefM family antitoxin component YafN of YafNO toxin-antitoxin module
MKHHSPQYITDINGKKLSVILPVKDYERMLEELEDQEDVRAYDEVKSRNEESIPFEQYLKERKRSRNG